MHIKLVTSCRFYAQTRQKMSWTLSNLTYCWEGVSEGDLELFAKNILHSCLSTNTQNIQLRIQHRIMTGLIEELRDTAIIESQYKVKVRTWLEEQMPELLQASKEGDSLR